MLKNKHGLALAKKIIEKTGPKKIFVCSKNENGIKLSIKAWKNLEKKIDSKKIKNLIYVTENTEYKYPGNGYIFASKTNLNSNINIFDINSGCSGFVDALYLSNKLKGNSLIVTSETYSLNQEIYSRSTSSIFSDGASVFYFEKKKIEVVDSDNIFIKNTYDNIRCKIGENLEMKGANVFNFFTSKVVPMLSNLIFKYKKLNLKKIYIHQASNLVLNYSIDYFSGFKNKIPINLNKIGNTVSSTIPILIYDDLSKKNEKLIKNDYIILCGFGVGLTARAVLLKILE